MRKVYLISFILLASCSSAPPEGQLQTALAQTLTAQVTNTPTPSPTSTNTPLPTDTPTPIPSPTPDVRIIIGHSEDFLLKAKDLPDQYYNPGGHNWDSPTTNAEILGFWGVDEGSKYVDATGRIEGHIRCLLRSTKLNTIPEEICLQIIFYETDEGASLALSPDWDPLGSYLEKTFINDINVIGDESYVAFTEKRGSGGLYTINYIILFRVRNVMASVDGWGIRGNIDIEYLIDIALMMLEKLENAPLSSQ